MTIQKYLIFKTAHKVVVVDNIIKIESTSIYLDYDDKTGKVYGINNSGGLTKREILIKFKAKHWTRTYLITPDKKGEDCLNIDYIMTVPNFLLIKEKEVWKISNDIIVTIEDDPKNNDIISG